MHGSDAPRSLLRLSAAALVSDIQEAVKATEAANRLSFAQVVDERNRLFDERLQRTLLVLCCCACVVPHRDFGSMCVSADMERLKLLENSVQDLEEQKATALVRVCLHPSVWHPCRPLSMCAFCVLRGGPLQRLAGPFGFLEDVSSTPPSTLTALDILRRAGSNAGSSASALVARVELLEDKVKKQTAEIVRLESNCAQLLDEVRWGVAPSIFGMKQASRMPCPRAGRSEDGGTGSRHG